MVAGFHAHGRDIPVMGIGVSYHCDVKFETVYNLAVKKGALIIDKLL